jgi:transposase InsO family protein
MDVSLPVRLGPVPLQANVAATGPEPVVRDRFSPFDADDVDAVNLPRLTQEEVDELSDADVARLFSSKPLQSCIISDHLSEEQKRALRLLLLRNRDMFALNDNRPGRINATAVTIDTKDTTPAAFPLRPTMPHVRPVVEEHINDMLRYGLIRHSQSPWAAALLVIPKKGPNSWRVCCDFRLLNERTEKFLYPLPRVDDALASLNGNRYFTALDCVSAFWQIPLAEKDKHKTAFRCHMGQYEYNVMPQGIINGPAFFQRYVDTVLGSLKFQCALAYADDVLVYSPTFEQHVAALDKVFAQFRTVGFHFKAKKSSFAMPTVAYLGHVVSADGIAPDPMKVKAIADAVPTSREDIRSWHGLASYYRKFIRNFSKLVRPLTVFMNSKLPWKGLTTDMRQAIDGVKAALTCRPILDYPDFSSEFEIHCDASPHAIGATLCQRVAGVERVVQYISRSLKPHEENYHQYEREALAVVWATGVCRPYILGRRFKVVTDNKAVTRLFQKQQNSRLIRWVLTLQEYDIEFVHRTASKHGNADALSRMSCPDVDYGYEAEALVAEACCATCVSEDPSTCGRRHGCDLGSGARVCHPLHCSGTFMTAAALDTGHVGLPSVDSLRKAQGEDPALGPIVQRLQSDNGAGDVRPVLSGDRRVAFYLQKGVLMRRTNFPMRFRGVGEGSETVDQICVPKSMRRAVLLSAHGIPMSGHDGVLRTQMRVREHFWWPHYDKDVTAWVRSCVFCQRRKTNKPNRQGLTEPILSSSPFEVMGFDIVGPLPEDKDGNKYLLTAIDHFTRYPLAIPITNREQATVVHALHRHVVCVFGPPKRLLSDCEASFVSAVTKGLFALMGISTSNTTPYHPQTNGACERFHRYLNASLTMFVNSQKTDWSDYVDSLLFAYRTSFCSSTGYTPFEMLFGRKARMPLDIFYDFEHGQVERERARGISVSESMRTAYSYARERQERAAALNKRYRDKKRSAVFFKDGDLVWRYDRNCDKQGPQKLQFRFSGPHVIVKASGKSSNLYVISDCKTRETRLCNVDELVPAHHDCSDLGLPLGWRAGQRKGRPGTFSPPVDPSLVDPGVSQPGEDASASPALKLGDMVALQVEPDELEKIPFAVGEVISLEGHRLTVWWYGNSHGNVLGAWRPGYVQSSDNRRYYDDRKLHPSHSRYTSAMTETALTRDHVIGTPFELNRRNALPMHVLKAVTDHPDVCWSLPRHELDMLIPEGWVFNSA